ncbi:MAG: hypothetical protein KAU01_06275 [Candidatus Cloacimonetes bacterium]|nr:hypothetical protein [Candidatus Cloacimonadota bacterium]
MKATKIVLSIAILGLAMNLSASVRINGLGSYFEYLIPDTETDFELFPSHLCEYDSKYVQIINNGSYQNYDGFNAKNVNFSIMPLAKKLFFKINADFASNDREPRIYLDNIYSYYGNSTYFDGSEYGASLVTNSLSYELSDNFHLGCFFKYGINWREIVHDELEKEDPDFIIYEDIEDIDYDNDYISTGINFRLASNFKTDITIMYSKNDIEDFIIDKYDYERFYSYSSGENHSDRYIRENSESIECETEDMGVSFLLETEDIGSINRYFLESHYFQQSSGYKYFYFHHHLDYDDNELDYERKDISEDDKVEEMEVYTATLGFGKSITKDKWNMYYGVKLNGMYGETTRDESYYFLDYYYNVEPDTTYTDSISISGENNFEIKDWKVAIEVPFGVSYTLNKTVQFFGGVGLKLIRQELEYFEDNEFSRWETDRYVAFGTTISPLECLKIDVNYGSDFAKFSGWQLDLKYLW